MIDNRVQETKKTGENSYIRKAGHIKILYSYFTEVAVYNEQDDVLFVGDHKWSHSTKCHIGKFRRMIQAEEECVVDSIELQIVILDYLASRLKAARRGNDPNEVEFLPENEGTKIKEDVQDLVKTQKTESDEAIVIRIGSQDIIFPRVRNP